MVCEGFNLPVLDRGHSRKRPARYRQVWPRGCPYKKGLALCARPNDGRRTSSAYWYGPLRRPAACRAPLFFLTYRIRCKGAKFVSSGLYVESARPRWPIESSLSRFAGPGFVPCAAAFNLHPHGVVSRRLRRPMGHKWRAYRCCSIRDLSRSSATASLRSICSTTHARCLHSIGGLTSRFCHEQSRTRMPVARVMRRTPK